MFWLSVTVRRNGNAPPPDAGGNCEDGGEVLLACMPEFLFATVGTVAASHYDAVGLYRSDAGPSGEMRLASAERILRRVAAEPRSIPAHYPLLLWAFPGAERERFVRLVRLIRPPWAGDYEAFVARGGVEITWFERELLLMGAGSVLDVCISWVRNAAGLAGAQLEWERHTDRPAPPHRASDRRKRLWP